MHHKTQFEDMSKISIIDMWCIYIYSNHYLYFIFAHCMFYITNKKTYILLQDPQCRYLYIHTSFIYIYILYTSYIDISYLYVYTVHPTCLCMNISTAYISGKMFPSRQTSRHWHWGRTQKIRSVQGRLYIYISL